MGWGTVQKFRHSDTSLRLEVSPSCNQEIQSLMLTITVRDRCVAAGAVLGVAPSNSTLDAVARIDAAYMTVGPDWALDAGLTAGPNSTLLGSTAGSVDPGQLCALPWRHASASPQVAASTRQSPLWFVHCRYLYTVIA